MKTSFLRVLLAILVFAAGALVGAGQDKAAAETAAQATERIGVYDSRAVAVAFAGSPAHSRRLDRLRERQEAAKAAGDSEGVSRAVAEARAGQRRAHLQAFSTAPVDDILAELADVLPAIKKEVGVSALVSKWDEPELRRHAGADRVDVTSRLIDACQPTERQRRSAMEIQKHAPIPLERAAGAMD